MAEFNYLKNISFSRSFRKMFTRHVTQTYERPMS